MLGAFHHPARVHSEVNAKQFVLESNNFSGIRLIFRWSLSFCWGHSIIPPECTLRLMPKIHPGSARFPSGGFLFAGGFPPQYTLRRMCANGGRRCAWHVGRARRKQFLLKQFFHQSEACPGRIKKIVSRNCFSKQFSGIRFPPRIKKRLTFPGI